MPLGDGAAGSDIPFGEGAAGSVAPPGAFAGSLVGAVPLGFAQATRSDIIPKTSERVNVLRTLAIPPANLHNRCAQLKTLSHGV